MPPRSCPEGPRRRVPRPRPATASTVATPVATPEPTTHVRRHRLGQGRCRRRAARRRDGDHPAIHQPGIARPPAGLPGRPGRPARRRPDLRRPRRGGLRRPGRDRQRLAVHGPAAVGPDRGLPGVGRVAGRRRRATGRPASWRSASRVTTRPRGRRRTAGRGRPRRTAPTSTASTQVRMTGVAGAPDGYVAVGYLGGLAGPIEARFWWSPDGRSWSLATLDGDPAGTRAAAVEAVPGAGFVAVGATGDARTADGSAVWTSPDGRTWTRVADQAALRQGVMRELTVAGRPRAGRPSGTRRTARGPSSGGRRTAPTGRSRRMRRASTTSGSGSRCTTSPGTARGWSPSAIGSSGRSTRRASPGSPRTGWRWDRATESAALSQGKIDGVTAVGGGFAAVGHVRRTGRRDPDRLAQPALIVRLRSRR